MPDKIFRLTAGRFGGFGEAVFSTFDSGLSFALEKRNLDLVKNFGFFGLKKQRV